MDLKKIDVKKVIIFSALGVGTVIGATIAIKQVIKLFNKDSAESKDEKKELESSGMELTLPESTLAAMADSIYNAGFIIGGTDEDAIYSQFNKLGNDLDYITLNLKFGKRREEFSWGDSASMATFLRGELSDSEIAKVNSILSSKGITYTV